MFNFFQSILDTISLVINYAVNFVAGLMDFIESLVAGSAYLVEVIAFLPVQILGIASVIVAAAVFFAVLNR